MWVSRPGIGLETDQDHFFEVLVLVLVSLVLVSVLVSACLVLVLVSEGGLEQDLSCSTEQPDDASQSSQPAPPKKRRTSLFSYDTSSTTATTTGGSAPVLTYIDFVSSGKASSLKEIADQDQFKTLHKLFERVFCTPATSASVERVFSHGGYL